MQNILKAYFQQLPQPINSNINTQFKQKISQHSNFNKIIQKFIINSPNPQPLQFIDPDYINLLSAENMMNNSYINEIQSKLQALNNIDQIIYEMELLQQGLINKQKQIKTDIQSYKSRQNDLNEQKQILIYENNKLLKQLNKKNNNNRIYQKTVNQLSDSEEQDNNNKNQNINQEQQARKQLQKILIKFNCIQKGFPKNKTQSLMLINKIQSQIQKIQMEKLNSYSLQINQ